MDPPPTAESLVTVIEIAGLSGLGLFAGLLIGCVGIGGVIVVPALTYIAGTPIQSSIAAAMMAYILSGAVGTAVYARNGSIRWPMALWLSGGAMPAALFGARMSNVMQPRILEVSVGLLTLISGFYALVPRTADGSGNPEVPTLALACIGVVTGLLSAITGTGGPLVLNRNLPFLGGCECAGEAELGDLAGEAVGLNFGRGTAEVIVAEVLVEGAVAEHVVGGGQDRGGDGTDVNGPATYSRVAGDSYRDRRA